MDIVRDGRFRWAAAIIIALMGVSLASGWQQYRMLAAEHDAAQPFHSSRFTFATIWSTVSL